MKNTLKNFTPYWMFIVIIFFIHPGSYATNDKSSTSSRLMQWEVGDMTFKSNHINTQNPFEINFGAIFKHENSLAEIKIDGFFDGNNTWKIRFSSELEGVWNYHTYSSVPDLAGLKGIVIVVNDKSGKKGAIKIDHSNAQKFVYEDGSSHFSMAFELDWLFALDYNNKSDIPRTKQIISDIECNGFNQILMNVYAYDVNWLVDRQIPEEYQYQCPGFFIFEGTNKTPEYSKLNVDFFRHFDRIIRYLHEKNIYAHIMIYVWNKKVNWPDAYSKADNMYFDYVIKRYQAFSNVIWDISKEALDYSRCNPEYISERIDRIRKKDTFKRLITVHDYDYCLKNPDKVDFLCVQSWRNNIYDLMLKARLNNNNKPIVNVEHGGYEEGPFVSFSGNYTSAETCLERAYECVFAGVYTTYYWQNTAWNIVVYNPFDNKYSLKPPRFDYYRHLSGLFEKYNFNTLSPVDSKISTNGKSAFNNYATNGYVLTNHENLFIYLVPGRVEILNIIIPKSQSGEIQYTWFNPLSGEYIDYEVTKWSGWKKFVSPWQGNLSVLVVETK